MRRLAALLLDGLPQCPATERAVAATLADWRHEAGQTHVVGRLFVGFRYLAALARALTGSAIRQLAAEVRSPFLWRVLAGVVVVVLALGFIPMFPTVAKGTGAFTLMSLAQGLWLGGIFIPAALFVAEATGRRSRKGPSLASAIALSAGVGVWLLVISPEVLNFLWAIHLWGATPNGLPPAPSVLRWGLGQPTQDVSLLFLTNRLLTWTVLSVSFWSLAILAFRIRTLGVRSRPRRVAVVCGAVILASVLIPVVAVLPNLLVPGPWRYAWLFSIAALAFASLTAAGALARRTADRGLRTAD